MIAFNKYYNSFNILSITLVFISLSLLIFKGLNFGIDFKGGTLIELRTTDKSNINLKGARNGEATSTAIIEDPLGKISVRGNASKL